MNLSEFDHIIKYVISNPSLSRDGFVRLLNKISKYYDDMKLLKYSTPMEVYNDLIH